MNKEISFLTLADIVAIHENQIELYGGDSGVRDYTLLSSAISIVEATFDGNYLQKNIYEMGAAYCFHICQNHPFVDGNKRVALVSALIFFDFNDIKIDDEKEELYEIIMSLAKGKVDKYELADLFRRLSK
jgi:death-on-curing protein